MRSVRKAAPGPGEDPLNLQAPPTSGDAGLEEDDYEMLLADGDYEAAGLNPDSAVADIESLLAQEKLLGEQTKWWEDRLKTEASARKAFQAEMKAQDAQFSREVRDLQDLISELRSEQAEAEEQAHFLVCEAKDYENEAVVAGREVEMLKPKIAELRKSIFTSPRSVTSKGGTPTGAQRGTLSGDKPAATPSQRSLATSAAPTPGESAGALKSEQGSSRSNRGPGSQGSRDKSPVEEKLDTESIDMNDMFGGGANKSPSSKSSARGVDVGAAPSRNAGNGNRVSISPESAESMDFDFLGGGGGGAPAPKAKAFAAQNPMGNFGPQDSMDFGSLLGGGAPAPKAAAAPAGGMAFMAMDTDMLGGDMDFMNIK
mmetsp:Transcript_148755/g.257623  ORF Transcript_148755/g.257623 Transcript_148755/m.257623 type:complete len:371 (+) Transcript_148755:740-1852(+)